MSDLEQRRTPSPIRSTSTADAAYLAELRDLVLLHARAQGISPAECRQVLAGITSVDQDGPGSWSDTWLTAAEERQESLAACRRNILARFPYPATPGQRLAVNRCVDTFDAWRTRHGGIERLVLPVLGEQVPVWASADDQRARPLLLVMGGIVSVKEQWAQFLLAARRLGMHVVVAEMPGVGENPLGYDVHSWRMLPALLDAVSAGRKVTECYGVLLSFSGHLGLRWASHDPRLRGMVTVGAPVAALFTDRTWWPHVPMTTKRTLAHLTGWPVAELPDRLAEFALSPAELAEIDIPVHYVLSGRDEIVPASESRLLADTLPQLSTVEFDDVHGSPAHLTDTKLWIIRALMQMHGAPRPVTAALGGLLRLRRAIRR
jgi:pimeloyl-ACP methyl ester carboxylesterase